MSDLKLSTRAQKTPPSPIRKLAGMAQAASDRGLNVYRLNIGQPDLRSPEEFLSAVPKTLHPVVAYESSQGSLALRSAWSDYLNRSYPKLSCSADDLLITSGASEALIFAFMVCCDPGDEILIFDPTYANYIGFAAISGVRLVPLACPPESGRAVPSVEEIERYVSPYTRAILVCNPNNPTGSVCDDTELFRLLEICRREHLFLIVDETYREFVYDGLTPRCIFELAPRDPNVIVVDSLSKRFSLCGARIGALMTWNSGVMQAAFHIAQARLAAATIEQEAASVMLRSIDDSYISQARSEYLKRRDLAVGLLKKIPGVKPYVPRGGFYLLAELPVDDAEDFASFMLNDFEYQGATTFVAPAAGFYMLRASGRRVIRIAFVLNEDDMRKAIAVLAAGLESYRREGRYEKR